MRAHRCGTVPGMDHPSADPDGPPCLGAVATDGGPVLLGPHHALRDWAGARPDGAPIGDYHDACQQWQGDGALTRHGATIVVLPATSADVLQHPDGTLWLAIEGNLEELWAARADLTFRPLGRTLPGDDVTLLDAAYSLDGAQSDVDRVLVLPRLGAEVALDEGTEAVVGGYFRVIRLRPT